MHSVLAIVCYIFVSTVSANSIRDRIRQLENEGHDLSHIEQANLRRVISQNSDMDSYMNENVYGNNETMSSDNNHGNETPSRCKSCAIREEQKKHRIEGIKKKISHALNLDLTNMPNATGVKLPKVPSFLRLMERYERESNSPYRQYQDYEDEEDEFGQPERTYTFARQPPDNLFIEDPNASFFSIPNMVGKTPYKAYLWIYIKPSDAISPNITEINLYALHPPEVQGDPPIRRRLQSKRRHFDNLVGWHHFNVISEVQRWSANPRNNHGVVIEALDLNGNNLVVLPPTVGIDEEYIPMLDIRTTLRVTRRSKRSAVALLCDDTTQYEACCRYPLMVDFVEFGWDFVIAPNTYQAYYCAGECQSENLDATDHAIIVNQHTSLPGTNPGPCCTPTRMSALSMLYWDVDQSVQYTRLPNMKVERCGCA